ncbi:uncharacterized protein [Oryza sativa Japonica Group]|uniref:Os03g0305200 protein n=2 Tax=Oryza sativa subsp. japonica TaxID=39947 RepID=A3AH57_ORYSJ|nr:uncharacterized protein LOC4332594 [Oryza sativa Japonica Group]ABF95519.1 expressed protein [Oryza sativa Japonica Group]EAZ26646.1 hypothetical protein OsJ_10549 [Oryza sativa Japonica Group]KAF2938867.1 hypothetical protein DAI22_03g149800 [Oryza sativa Japonica Group]BAF11795.1 Os03g0305200 [Oryza sativa Japonica Group]BAG98408.1 unnamed protein product [Oryza sativa Japonica Group]|eukprot:NP_001049881.1 Os03g0305200 [Oryza sativa Japonica Group]
MGNLISSGAVVGASGGGKVVMADGSVRALSEPVSVAELMMDHPRHFVIDARDLQQQRRHKGKAGAPPPPGGKVAPLPADHVLGAGGVYVLLPATTRGKVSAEEARRALTASRSLERSRSMPGRLRRKLSSKKMTQEADNDGNASENHAAAAEAERREETAAAARPPPADGFEEHRPEFLSRELSSRGWKPSLITIEERVAPKKVSHWLF